MIVFAHHYFDPEEDNEIALNKGEPIVVLQKDELYNDGWWKGVNLAGNVGLFPSNYVTTENIFNIDIESLHLDRGLLDVIHADDKKHIQTGNSIEDATENNPLTLTAVSIEDATESQSHYKRKSATGIAFRSTTHSMPSNTSSMPIYIADSNTSSRALYIADSNTTSRALYIDNSLDLHSRSEADNDKSIDNAGVAENYSDAKAQLQRIERLSDANQVICSASTATEFPMDTPNLTPVAEAAEETSQHSPHSISAFSIINQYITAPTPTTNTVTNLPKLNVSKISNTETHDDQLLNILFNSRDKDVYHGTSNSNTRSTMRSSNGSNENVSAVRTWGSLQDFAKLIPLKVTKLLGSPIAPTPESGFRNRGFSLMAIADRMSNKNNVPVYHMGTFNLTEPSYQNEIWVRLGHERSFKKRVGILKDTELYICKPGNQNGVLKNMFRFGPGCEILPDDDAIKSKKMVLHQFKAVNCTEPLISSNCIQVHFAADTLIAMISWIKMLVKCEEAAGGNQVKQTLFPVGEKKRAGSLPPNSISPGFNSGLSLGVLQFGMPKAKFIPNCIPVPKRNPGHIASDDGNSIYSIV